MHTSIRSATLVLLMLFVATCTIQRKFAGYQKITSTVDTNIVKTARAAIRGISNDMFTASQFKGTHQQSINFRLLAPAGIEKDRHYPLVVVFHGSGAIGTDNTSQMGVLAKLWAQPNIRDKYPAFVVAPQFPVRSSNYTMDDANNVLVSRPGPVMDAALDLIDSLAKALPVDGRRIYLVGFSMGGSTVVNCINSRPGMFAAGVAISGIPAFSNLPSLSSTHLWIIHGNADHENPFATDSLLRFKLPSADGLRFWEIDKLEHEIYSGLYLADALPNWLFRWHKSESADNR